MFRSQQSYEPGLRRSYSAHSRHIFWEKKKNNCDKINNLFFSLYWAKSYTVWLWELHQDFFEGHNLPWEIMKMKKSSSQAKEQQYNSREGLMAARDLWLSQKDYSYKSITFEEKQAVVTSTPGWDVHVIWKHRRWNCMTCLSCGNSKCLLILTSDNNSYIVTVYRRDQETYE